MTDTQRILMDIKLSDKRMRHTLGVVSCAKMLAQRHFPFLSPEKIEAAALLHDFTKEYSTERQLELCAKYSIPVSPREQKIPKLYHAKTAAALALQVYGQDKEVADAIYFHTTGKADMSPAESVIYLADYIEEFREDKGCVRVRDYYNELYKTESDKQRAFYMAILFSFDITIKHIIKKGELLSSESVEARNFLLEKLYAKTDIVKPDKRRNGEIK